MTQDITGFHAYQFSAALNKGLADMNFTIPSPIQEQAIPLLLNGQDLIGLAQTGTGKTAAFALPILEKLSPELLKPQALILAPTRELAIQVAEQFELLGAHQRGTSVAVLCGGQDYARQLKMLRAGAQIVVGTPGRILDHLSRGTLSLGELRTFVLDEADEMLRMGFIEDVEAILAKLPEKRQMALFSATMPYRIRQIANKYLQDPASVDIKMATATVKSTEQRYLFVPHHQKIDALIRILEVETYQGVIVFVRTKSGTDEVADKLREHGLSAMAINGDLPQAQRVNIISQFKQGSINILVATDVAARGLDVERVTHVINYDIPHDNETYVHRIGRTGRAGRSGVTILFVTPKESRLVASIERHTRQSIEKMSIPNDHQIQTARKERLMNRITERLEHEHLPAYQRIIEEYLKDNEVSADQVAAALALLLHNDQSWQPSLPKIARFEERSYESAESRGARPKRREFSSDRQNFSDHRKTTSPDQNQALFRIEVGRIHGVKPGNIVGAIANEAGLKSRSITALKIHEDHSTVCLPKGMPKEVISLLTKAWVCGRQLNLKQIASS